MRRKVRDAGSVAVRKARIKGGGGAARARRKLNKEGGASCQHCRLFYPAAGLHIDHRLALQHGGTDTETNLQILCKPCHGSKTIEENQRRRSEKLPQRR
ncbi:MAG: HNH endonuclease [Phycisphaerales bacterium]|jgi:5-methylcytosine-specific restriction protein A|tara:strand:- start:46 stop:342 length:297 start_codon:yes stop_codon:yes gene_type:complete